MDALDGEWKPAPIEEQPRPVILDPNRRARLPKLLHLVSLGEAKSPLVFCRNEGQLDDERHVQLDLVEGKFSWDEIMLTLLSRGIRSIMIEGGASVIADVLRRRLADVVIITVAPVFIGSDGVGIHASLYRPEWLDDTKAIAVGKDMVIAGRIKR